MKKILFALCAMLMAVVHANAQTSIIATLSHEGDISAYYGSNALIEAYQAAADGDIISLSPGLFNAVDIAKAVTVRGSGCDNDPSTGRQATYISGDFKLSKSENSDEAIVIEGIFNNDNITCYGNGLKLQLLKSRLYYLGTSNAENQEISIINCRIVNYFTLGADSNAVCLNSIIRFWENYIGSSINFKNCYLNCYYSPQRSLFDNCIIYRNGPLASSTIVNNCIGSGVNNIFKEVQGINNTYIEDLSSIFDSYSQDIDDIATYVLTDEAKAAYIGSDGTEVGIYGGMIPFSTTPSSPQITKFKVAEKSTADGKLSIDITISMPE